MKKVYFASDAHLGNRYLQNPMDAEKKLVAWLDDIKNDAVAVYFLGDMFDYWFEYKYVVPRGHVRFLGKVAELSDMGIEIHFLIGNHDIWMFDYLQKEIGAAIHHKPIQIELSGKHFFLAHGDEVGYSTARYRFIQSVFRNRICQILYSSIHPRWTFGFARRWSLSSRKSGLEEKKFALTQERGKKALEKFAFSYLQKQPGIDFFLFGHLHVIHNQQLTPNSRMIILGDWMTHFSYAVWDGNEMNLETIKHFS